jgi:hypothetical protein
LGAIFGKPGQSTSGQRGVDAEGVVMQRQKLTLEKLACCVREALENETILMPPQGLLEAICFYLNSPEPRMEGRSRVMEAARAFHDEIHAYLGNGLVDHSLAGTLIDLLPRLQDIGANIWPLPRVESSKRGQPRARRGRDVKYVGYMISEWLSAAGYQGDVSLTSSKSATAIIGAAIIGCLDDRMPGDFTADDFADCVRKARRDRGQPEPLKSFEEQFPEASRIKIN